MKTITTYNGIKLVLVEVTKDAKDFYLLKDDREYSYIQYYDQIFNPYPTKRFYLDKIDYMFIGTTSTLTDEQIKPFIEILEQDESITTYKDYLPITDLCCCTIPSESFNSLLEANNIDLSKEWVVLQIKNN